MTFSVVNKPNGTTLEVYPKPIAYDDPGLTALEQEYANIDTQILSGATVVRLNTDATARANAFWADDSIEVVCGDAPWDLMKTYSGAQVISHTMVNGQKMYMVYDGDVTKGTLKFRLFTWYGITNKNPSANGCFTTF